MSAGNQKIIPHLWYDKEAEEASEFYASIFPGSKVIDTTIIPDTPSGQTKVVAFELWGQRFTAVSAGAFFKFNPSISFMINIDPLFFENTSSPEKDAINKLDEIWDALSQGGSVLMPIGKYPFSERYGWIQDKYGLSWQLILTIPEGDPRPAIVPNMLFVGDNCGKAEEAIDHYLSIFKNSQMGCLFRYGPGQETEKEEDIMFADFMLENYWFAIMDSASDYKFSFNEAVSFMINCGDQEEIDYYWKKLSAVPEAEQCGWIKDRYGVSWQILPSVLDEMLRSGTREQIERVSRAFLQMKKFDISSLQKAYEEE